MKSLGDTWTNYRGPTEQWSQGVTKSKDQKDEEQNKRDYFSGNLT